MDTIGIQQRLKGLQAASRSELLACHDIEANQGVHIDKPFGYTPFKLVIVEALNFAPSFDLDDHPKDHRTLLSPRWGTPRLA